MSRSAFPYRTLAIAALSTIGASALATEYSLEAIIDPDGGTVWPRSISEDGTVVGQNWRSGAPPACFKYFNGVYSLLPLPSDASECLGAAIDPKGNVTLTYRPKEGGNLRIIELTTRGKFRALQAPFGTDNYVFASNNGRMAGMSVTATGQDAYVFNRTDQGVNVGVLTGHTRSQLRGINSRGVAVGYVDPPTGKQNRPFVYQKGQIYWLMPLSDGARTYALAINKLNVVVGYSHLDPANTDESQRATSWTSSDTAQNLGLAYGSGTYANAINGSNHAVGGATSRLAGILFKDGTAVELGELLTADQKAIWGSVGPAYAINDKGLIAGQEARRIADGTLTTYAYLLRPLP